MTSAKHTIGVIGLGSIGRRHATNLWQNLGQTEVIGYDIELTDKVGWVCGDLDFLLKTATAVVIASPTDLHIEHANLVADYGKPMLLEKPFGSFMPIPECTLMKNLDKVLMVGYNLRFHPCVRQAKDWFDAGDNGDPIWANFTLGQRSIKPPYLRDGVILNWSHEIDLCLYLLGSGSVTSSCTRLPDGQDDLTDIIFKHVNGCHSVIHLDYITQPEVRQTIIQGKKGAIILDLVSHNAWLRGEPQTERKRLSRWSPDDSSVLEHVQGNGWDETYIEEMQTFLDLIDGKKPIDPGCSAKEGLEVLKICLEVRKQAGL